MYAMFARFSRTGAYSPSYCWCCRAEAGLRARRASGAPRGTECLVGADER